MMNCTTRGTARKPVLTGAALALGLVAALRTGEPPADRDPQSLLLRVVGEGPALLSRGTPAPDFELPACAGNADRPDAAGGRTVSLDGLKGESSGVVFVSFSCRYSRQLMRAVLDEGPPDLGMPLLFIKRGGDTGREPTPEETELQAELETRFLLLEDDGSTFDAYRSNRVPTTYLLDAEGRIERSGVGEPEGAELVKTLFENALKRKRT